MDSADDEYEVLEDWIRSAPYFCPFCDNALSFFVDDQMQNFITTRADILASSEDVDLSDEIRKRYTRDDIRTGRCSCGGGCFDVSFPFFAEIVFYGFFDDIIDGVNVAKEYSYESGYESGLESADDELSTANDRIENLSYDITAAEELLSEKEDENSYLRDEIADLREDIESIQAARDELEDRLLELEYGSE